MNALQPACPTVARLQIGEHLHPRCRALRLLDPDPADGGLPLGNDRVVTALIQIRAMILSSKRREMALMLPMSCGS